MKRLLFVFAYLALAFVSASQTQTYIRHKYYDVVFSLDDKIPVYVIYGLTNNNFDATTKIDREDYRFKADPELDNSNFSKAYEGSGYDRGHMMPAANNSGDAVGMEECFYYTNITPQTPELNRRVWKALESKERKYASDANDLLVMCGNIGYRSDLEDGVTVPKYCWKILIITSRATGISDTLAYLFPDDQFVVNNLEEYVIPYRELEQGIRFNIGDMVSLYELKDSEAQAEYLIEKAMAGIKTNSALPIQTVLEKYSSAYVDFSKFRQEFAKEGVDVPANSSMEDFLRTSYTDYKTSYTNEASKYINALRQTSDMGFLMNESKTLSGFFEQISQAGFCSCCGLPLAFPVCGCRL